jgi:hypothetical protein
MDELASAAKLMTMHAPAPAPAASQGWTVADCALASDPRVHDLLAREVDEINPTTTSPRRAAR